MDKKYIFDKAIFADRIRQARKSRNLTQEALSTLLNVNVNTLAKCESPKNKLTFSYTNMIELVNILDIDVNYLFRVDSNSVSPLVAGEDIHTLIDHLTEREKRIALSLVRALLCNRTQL
jgi:transcriptional regulator with XRE-family HTH domain